MRFRTGQSGQAAVETAIVMPLNMFLILGIIQFGLISQARYMAKYAAYRAVRVGTMNNGDTDKMLAAAQAALLPVMAMPHHSVWALVMGKETNLEVIDPTTDMTSVATKALFAKINNMILPGLNMVAVTICGPVSGDLTSISESNLTGVGSSNQVDFDDPRSTFDMPSIWSSDSDLQSFLATKLRVQVAFNYVMPIPFANWIISRAYLGMTMPDVLRMGDGSPWASVGSKLWLANSANIYIAPIFENYAMRMQSNLYLSKDWFQDEDNCVSFAKANPDK